jgi:hypothetical protein
MILFIHIKEFLVKCIKEKKEKKKKKRIQSQVFSGEINSESHFSNKICFEILK